MTYLRNVGVTDVSNPLYQRFKTARHCSTSAIFLSNLLKLILAEKHAREIGLWIKIRRQD